MPIRLIVTDVDRTIKPTDQPISERTKKAIRACTERGCAFALVTGRNYYSAYEIVKDLDLPVCYLLYAGGGAAARVPAGGNEELLMEWTITEDKAQSVYEHAKDLPVRVNAFVPGHVYSARAHYCSVRDFAEFNRSVFILDDSIFDEHRIGRPYKMEIYTEDNTLREKLRGEYLEMGFDVTSSNTANLEIMMPDHGKGTAVSWLCGYLNVPKEQCIAFGDDTNDISMLRASGIPVAMSNGAEALKRVAVRIAPDVCEDGVAQILESLMESGEI